MKYFILCLTLLLWSITVSAYSLDISGLSEQQRAELALSAAKMKDTSPVTPQEVKEWLSIGEAVGTGFAATAKTLGVTVNELASTPVGVFAILLIAFHYLVGPVFAFLWLTFTLPVWIYLWRRSFIIDKIVYYNKTNDKRKEIIMKEYDSKQDIEKVLYWFTLLGICVVGIIATFA